MRARIVHGSGETSDCFCFSLRKATRSITYVYDAALRPSGLRATQFTVLNVVRRLALAGVTKIADVAVIDRTTLTRSLAVLERAGLVRVVPSTDVRERLYALTSRGAHALARARPRWDAAQALVIERLGSARVHRLLGDLGAVVRTVRAAKRERRTPATGRGRA